MYDKLGKNTKSLSLCPSGGALPPSSSRAVVLHAEGPRSHVLRVVLQTANKLLHRFSLVADLIDGSEEGKPADTTGDQEDTEEPEPQEHKICSFNQPTH